MSNLLQTPARQSAEIPATWPGLAQMESPSPHDLPWQHYGVWGVSPPAFKGQVAILCSRGGTLGTSSVQCHSEGRQPSLTLLVDPVS